MIFTLKDVGPIKEAQIDLSHDLTIFTGPNNTGKTSVNYRIVEAVNTNSIIVGIDYLDKLISNVTTIEAGNISFDCNNEEFLKFICHISYFTDSIELSIQSARDIILSLNFEDYIKLFDIPAKVSKEKHKLQFILSFNADISEKSINQFCQNFITIYLRNKIRRLDRLAFFPAERIATATFGFQQTSGNLSNFNKELYPLAILQHLDMVSQDKLIQNNKAISDYSYLSVQIEEILGGRFVRKETGADVFIPKGSETELGVAFTGSMVKSLHALVNYFRRRAQHADLLVLDEPEMNLHPDNQIKMARLIVEWVNAGFKVLISTHSNYILRELNNMILLSEKPKSKQSAALRKKYGYEKEHLISKDNVGVHFFNDGKVAQIPVTDDGFEIKTIEEAVFDLNERSEEIFFKHDR